VTSRIGLSLGGVFTCEFSDKYSAQARCVCFRNPFERTAVVLIREACGGRRGG
jgi:esterase/lipase